MPYIPFLDVLNGIESTNKFSTAIMAHFFALSASINPSQSHVVQPYVPYMPEKPGPHPDNREAIYILEKKLASTHNDVEQELFSAMVSMLKYMDEKSSEKQYFFGTDFFERIWEKMIDKAFGIEDKDQYFPRTRWLLDYGPDRTKTLLQPDTIMIYNGKVYLLALLVTLRVTPLTW